MAHPPVSSTSMPSSPSTPMRPLYTSCREHHRAQDSPPRFLCLNELPRMPSPSPPRRQPDTPSPFLRLPVEIRLQIYGLLLLPRKAHDLCPSFEKVHSSTHDSFDYEKREHGTDRLATANLARPTLLIRTIDPLRYHQRYPALRPEPARAKYSVRCDRFRAACRSTTYHCVNLPRIEDQLGIVRASKQIHAECAEVLYGAYTFDFDTHVEALAPFLGDLTPFARSCVKSVRLVKRALAYEKEFDRCEWSHALRYLTSTSAGVGLRRLDLGVVAGRPGLNGWDRVATYSAADFKLLRQLETMEWMQYLMEIRGLQELEVSAVVEHCPPATNSMAMARYIQFSASVETGFREYLRENLLAAKG